MNPTTSPTQKLSLPWPRLLAMNAYWLGINLSNGILTPLLLPYLIVLFMPEAQKNTYLGVVRVIGLAVAMCVQPLAGMLSDRSTSRFGRRRPFIFVGALLNVVFLALLGFTPLLDAPGAPSGEGIPLAFYALVGAIVLLQFSANIAHGAAQGLIPDLIPQNQRGQASGIKSVFELLPSFLIIFMGGWVDRGQIWPVLAIIMVGFIVTMAITVRWTPERPLEEKPTGSLREPIWRIVGLTVIFVGVSQASLALVRLAGGGLAARQAGLVETVVWVGLAGLAAMAGSIILGVYFGARVGIGREADQQQPFIWWVVNRLLFMAALGSIQGFAQYYLRDALHIPNAASMTTILLAVVAVFLIPASLFGGALADRVGLKRMVYISGWVAALGALVLLLARSMPLVIVAGAIIGLGAGIFLATNWALGTRLAPPGDAGRFLGISNLAGAGAGIVGAGIGGPMADYFNALAPGLGYIVIFALYAVLFALSSLLLGLVKEK